MTNQQSEKLFITFINTIIEKCADELGITADELRAAYVNDADVRKDLDCIFQRHIEAI